MNQTGAHDVKVPLQNFQLEEGNRWQWSQASMFAQADAAGYIFEHYRRLYPYSSGCFFWQYNEPWPTLSWSLVDYYKTPKRAMYRLAKSNAPRSFSIEDDSWILKDGKFNGKIFFVTNNENFAGTVTLQLVDALGNQLAQKDWQVDLPAKVTEIGQLTADCSKAASNIVLAVIKAVDLEGNEIFRADRIYGVSNFNLAFDLPKASVKVEHEILEDKLLVKVTNTSNTPVFSLRLQCDAKVCWMDNYQSFLPFEEITFEAHLLNGNKFSPKETIKVTGWNI
jgi:beta-mannosidase